MRKEPSPTGTEYDLLLEYLDFQRETVLQKTEGLSHAQLITRHPPSELTLAGILYHLTLVEANWMEVRFAGLADREPWISVDWDNDPNFEFRTAEKLEPDLLTSRYREAFVRVRSVIESADGLEQMSVQPLGNGEHFSLRWILLHLIEETARHAGHADFLREAIDGEVGE